MTGWTTQLPAPRGSPRARGRARHGSDASGREAGWLDPQRLALAAFVIVVVSNLHMHVPLIGKLRPGLVLWAFLVAYPILVPRSVQWRNLTSSWPPKAVVGFGVAAFLSIPFGISIGQSATFVIDVYSRVLLFSIVAIVSIRNVQDLRVLVWGYVISTAVLVYLSMFVMRVSAVAGGIDRIQSESGMYDSNDIGVLFMVGFALALLLLQTAQGWWGRLLSLTVVLGVPAAVAKTGSRGAFVGFVAVGLALFVLVRHIALAKRVGIVLVGLVALTLAAPAGYWDQMRTILDPEDDYNVSSEAGRIPILKRGIGYIAERPVFGVGISNFARAEATISEHARRAMPGDRVLYLAPHNTYLQVAAELGIPALILWLALIAGGTVGMIRMRRGLPQRWRSGTPDERFLYFAHVYLPVAFIGFAVPSVFVSHAYLPSFYLLVAFLAAVTVLTRQNLGGHGGPSPSLRRHRNPGSDRSRRTQLPM